MVLPADRQTTIRSITALGRTVDEAFAPMSVEITLADDIDAGRGDMIAKPHNRPTPTHIVDAMVCWFSPQALNPGGRYRIRHTTREALCVLKEVRYKVDVRTLHRKEGDLAIGMNDIGRVVSAPASRCSVTRTRGTASQEASSSWTNSRTPP